MWYASFHYRFLSFHFFFLFVHFFTLFCISSTCSPSSCSPSLCPLPASPHPLVIQDADGLRIHTPLGECCVGDTGSQCPASLVSCRRSPIQGVDIPDFSCLTRYFVHVSFLWLPGSGWIKTLISHQCVLQQ